MRLTDFHGRLYGTGGSYELNDVHRAFYAKIEEGYHGVYSGPREGHYLLAALTTALFHTTIPSEGPSALILTPAAESWALQQTQQVWAALLQSRKHSGRKKVQPLVDAMYRVYMGSRPLAMTAPPDRWVAFGFQNAAMVPSWMKGALA